MNAFQSLRKHLAPLASSPLRDERLCTCGEANHVRILLFRVGGLPAMFVVPETATLTAAQAEESLGTMRVEELTDAELCRIITGADRGRSPLTSYPLGMPVYFDECLLLYPSLVFCPSMFSGGEGECFRVPTREFLAMTQAAVVPLAPEPASVGD